MNIAICGGGIGGLVLAYALSAHTHLRVAVYEAQPDFLAMGTGLGLWRRNWRVLQELGLGDTMSRLCGQMSESPQLTVRFRKSDQSTGEIIGELTALGGLKSALRTEFHQALLLALHARENVSLHTSKKLVRYTEFRGAGVQLEFVDGFSALCDVLVGADGLRSAVRASMVALLQELPRAKMGQREELLSHIVDGRQVEEIMDESKFQVDLSAYRGAIWSGFLVYRAVLPRSNLQKIKADQHSAFSAPLTVYMGKDAQVTVFPIARDTAVNISIYKLDLAGAARRAPYNGKLVTDVNAMDVVRSLGTDWEPDVLRLLSCLDGVPMRQWAVIEVEDLPTYAHGRVVLIGDAAHAMVPNQGMGAGQAIEDAYVLSAILAHPLAETHVEAALDVYSRVRLPLTQSVVRLARRCAFEHVLRNEDMSLYESTASEHGQRVGLADLGTKLVNSHDWSESSAESEKSRALRLFERVVSIS